jgi:hypothetical protein
MMSKDTKKQLNKTPLEELNLSVYYPNFSNSPTENISIVKYGETHLLSKGGILTLCAKSGIGKSSVMEAFLSNHLNKNSDSLGIEINLQKSHNKILFIDTERSKWEVHKAWSKLMKRAGLTEDSELLIYASVKKLSAIEKIKFIDDILQLNTDIGLVVFDGASDFLLNTNDNVESSKFIDWINTFNENIALAFTIHTNPTDSKPRGHLGSELCRKSESVLNLNRQDFIYEITTDFDNGKNRHGKHETWNYKYCEIQDMFISTDEQIMPVIKPSKSAEKWREIALTIFEEKEHLSFGEIIEKIMAITEKTKGSSKNAFFDNFKDKICERVFINDIPFWILKKGME